MADVECPYCTYHLHAGRQCRRIIWIGLVVGGLIAAACAYGVYHFLGWSMTASIGTLFLIAIIVATILTGYCWLRNDYYVNS